MVYFLWTKIRNDWNRPISDDLFLGIKLSTLTASDLRDTQKSRKTICEAISTLDPLSALIWLLVELD